MLGVSGTNKFDTVRCLVQRTIPALGVQSFSSEQASTLQLLLYVLQQLNGLTDQCPASTWANVFHYVHHVRFNGSGDIEHRVMRDVISADVLCDGFYRY